MDKTVLALTFIVEMLLLVLRFISLHLRDHSRRRNSQELPRFELLPYDFRVDWDQSANANKGVLPPKVKLPRSRVV